MTKSSKKLTALHLSSLLILIIIGIAEIALVTWNWQLSKQQSASIRLTAAESGTSTLHDNLESLRGSELTLTTENQEFLVDANTFSLWLETYERRYTGRSELRINREAVRNFVAELAPSIDSKPTNGRFEMIDGALTERVPARLGHVLNIEQSVHDIIKNVGHGTTHTELSIDAIAPAISLATLQQLDITSLIGKGESDFSGSIESRAHNIHVAAEQFNGILIAPGETFSFNDNLGEVDASTGYLPGLVIKGDKLIPEYGGGVCQVSTTLFRAAIYAGLDIVERKAHSLPVRYYSPQGFDSTIYPGVVDLRFTNDTPSYILLQSHITGSTLTFEIYGRDDGRHVAVAGPVIYEAPGDGSLKTVLTRTVTDGAGNEIIKRFYSNYRAPSQFETIRNPLE